MEREGKGKERQGEEEGKENREGKGKNEGIRKNHVEKWEVWEGNPVSGNFIHPWKNLDNKDLRCENKTLTAILNFFVSKSFLIYVKCVELFVVLLYTLLYLRN